MIKRILLWTVFTGFVGLLVFGAVNRTAAKVDHDSNQYIRTEEGSGKEQPRDGSGNTGLGSNSGNNRQQGKTRNIKEEGSSREDLNDSNPEDHHWLVLTGTIYEVNSSSIRIRQDDKVIVEISGRAWRFAQESGYIPEVENDVELDGFYEDGEFKPAVIMDLTSGQVVLLRDESGHPLWSGGNRK
jgi:hypothetical protein